MSDDKVVEAAKKVVTALVKDTTDGAKEAMQKYGVRGYPAILFLDSGGKQVDKVGQRDAKSIVSKIESVAKKYSKKGDKNGDDKDGGSIPGNSNQGESKKKGGC